MRRQQSGFALLVFVILLLGIAGVALAGLGKSLVNSVAEQRLQHNKRVLNEAKQALLMYAYRHPQFNTEGPGRLPCPDDDNDGLIGTADLVQCTSVGRLPWDDPDLNFYEAKDASNEHLWYAVSDSFYNLGGGPVVNSSVSQGSITLVDQTGAIIYDGAATGLAAVIIAPGDAIARDENNDGAYEYTQVRSTVADRLDPANYLDTFAGFDNTGFNNGESDTDDDGFILGPIIDPALNTIVVNDQIAVITTDELIAYAEQGVLQAYKDALDAYLVNTGGVYPWLFDYNLNVAANDLDTSYPATSVLGGAYPNGAVAGMGRIPSIFTPYFDDDSNSSDPFASEVGIEMSLGFTVSGTNYIIKLDEVSSVSDQVSFNPAGPNEFDLDVQDPGDTLEATLFFWRIGGAWALCGDELSDCPAWVIFFNGDVLKVGLRADLTDDFTVSFDTPVATPTYLPPGVVGPTATHAFIEVDAPWVSVNDFPDVELYYERDNNFDGTFVADSDDAQEATSGDDLGPVRNPAIASAGVSVRYYPEIPQWAVANDWHIGIQMAVAPDHQPGGDGDCSDSICLSIADLGGTNDDKAALLVLAGSHAGIDDDDLPANGFNDNLDDLFEGNNVDPTDAVFDHRTGNDSILILQDN